jgi:hypothetical protein
MEFEKAACLSADGLSLSQFNYLMQIAC